MWDECQEFFGFVCILTLPLDILLCGVEGMAITCETKQKASSLPQAESARKTHNDVFYAYIVSEECILLRSIFVLGELAM